MEEQEYSIEANGLCWGKPKDNIQKDEIELCEKWIKEFAKERKTINTNLGSYRLKHIVEKHFKKYVSNGAFIQASKNLGFKIKPYTNLNAYFNMGVEKEIIHARQ